MAGFVDEFRHAPGPDALWNESWYFDVVAPDRAWGLYAQLSLFPNLGKAWWWSAIVRADEPLLLVRDHDLDLPRAGSLEVRGDGLWADVHCHDAMRRWQVNFEGIAVGLDDPSEAYRSERGDRVAVEFEFEWEADATWDETPLGYRQRCAVVGDAEIRGTAPLSLDEAAAGWRTHEWALHDWWNTDRVRLAGRDVSEDDLGGFDGIELVGGFVVEGVTVHRAATNVGWVEWVLGKQ